MVFLFFLVPNFQLVVLFFYGIPLLILTLLFLFVFQDTPISLVTKNPPEKAFKKFMLIAKINGI